MATEWKRVRVIAVNSVSGKAYAKTYKREPDAWTDYRVCKRPEILFATIGRVEKIEDGPEIFTPWETWRGSNSRELAKE